MKPRLWVLLTNPSPISTHEQFIHNCVWSIICKTAPLVQGDVGLLLSRPIWSIRDGYISGISECVKIFSVQSI